MEEAGKVLAVKLKQQTSQQVSEREIEDTHTPLQEWTIILTHLFFILL